MARVLRYKRLMEHNFNDAEHNHIDILVVEDEKHISRFLQFVLERARFSVAVLDRGESVTRLVEQIRPRAMVLDLILPGISGEEVLADLERAGLGEGLKIIVLTASSLAWGQDNPIAESVDAYCTKPIAPSKLLSTLTEIGIHVPGESS